MATIAALGTGVMGAPMARNLARAGHEVRAWNRSPDKAAALRDDGVDVRDDPAAAATGADVVLTMLADADAVLDVARRANLAEGQIWWQASTIGIEGIEQCAALAQETGAASSTRRCSAPGCRPRKASSWSWPPARTPRSTRSRRSSTRSGSGPCASGRRARRRG